MHNLRHELTFPPPYFYVYTNTVETWAQNSINDQTNSALYIVLIIYAPYQQYSKERKMVSLSTHIFHHPYSRETAVYLALCFHFSDTAAQFNFFLTFYYQEIPYNSKGIIYMEEC